MSKYPSIIGVVAPTQIGDCVCSLSVSRYIKKIFPSSYCVAVLDPRTKELAPLLLNNTDIDRIYISQKEEGYTKEEINWVNTFDFNLPLFGHYVPLNWALGMSPNEVNFRIRFQFEPLNSPFSQNGWSILNDEEKKPQLKQWFNFERLQKTIVISPFVGYSLENEETRKRSPSLNFWRLLTKKLNELKFKIIQIGSLSYPLINENNFLIDKRGLSLLEATKLSLGSDLFISPMGGMSIVINAYGHKSICLYSNWKNSSNHESLLPKNYKNNLISIFGENGLDSISVDEIIKNIYNLLA